MFNYNPITAADFYKTSHINQYPEGTQKIYSNFTPRSSRLARKSSFSRDGVVFFGLQGFLLNIIMDDFKRNFFDKNLHEVKAMWQRRMDTSLGPGAVGFDHIEALHNLGYLPVRIKAVKEGTFVPSKVPVLTIVNTKDEFFWVTNFLETLLSAELWKATTIATIAAEYKRMLVHFANLTGTPVEFTEWQGHDFSFRGIGGVQDCAYSAGHLLSFLGTDTIPAMDYLEQYYAGGRTFLGGSVPATEHSVMCAGGMDDEIETFRRLIEDLYPSGIVSIVSDTWDFWNVVGKGGIAEQLKDKILARTPNALGLAKTVFRPDSGDPFRIICGYNCIEFPEFTDLDQVTESVIDQYKYEEIEVVKVAGKYYKVERNARYYYGDYDGFEPEFEEISENEVLGSVRCLWNTFGGTETSTGHKMLNERVGLIYGDSITLELAEKILTRLANMGFASGNVVFGIGSYTYQYITRDTYGMAMKATWAMVNGEARELFKDPATDKGTKKSAKGLLRVDKDDNGTLSLKDQCTPEEEAGGELELVFEDGVLIRYQSVEEIRKLAAQ